MLRVMTYNIGLGGVDDDGKNRSAPPTTTPWWRTSRSSSEGDRPHRDDARARGHLA
jgi:hypothetical protein